MGFLDRVARGAEFRAAFSGLTYPTDWLADAFGTTRTHSGQRVSVKNAIGLAPVFAAVSIISEKVGELPFKVYRDIGDDERAEARQHRAWKMLHDQPNPVTSAHRFWATVAAQVLLWGNCYIEKRRSDGVLVDELWLCDPASVTIEWDAANQAKRFVVETLDRGRQTFTDENVLHIMGMSLNGLIGESVISRCRNAFGNALAREQFEGGFWQRGAVLSGVVEHPARLGEEGLKNLKASFNSIYGGSGNAHQTGVLEEGAKFKPMSMPLKDLEFVASQQLSRTDIAVMFKLPPNYLGGSTGDSLTYATVESNQIHFAQHTIAPLTSVIQQSVNADPSIFPQNVYFGEFTLDALLKADARTRADYYALMFEMVDEEGKRALTVDEIRALENRPPAVKPPTPAVLPPPQDLAQLTPANGAPANGKPPDVLQPLVNDTKLPLPRRPRPRF